MAIFFANNTHASAPVNNVSTRSSQQTLEKQVVELTRLVNARNKVQIRLQNQVNTLSEELREMRGIFEIYGRKIDQIEKRQATLYLKMEDHETRTKSLATKEVTSTQVENEKADYQSAVDLVLIDKNYKKAIQEFEIFIEKFPASSYAANSYYWLGQLFYKQKNREKSRTNFLVVFTKFPESAKSADSLYKVARIDEYFGEIDSAKEFYQKIVEKYPKTPTEKLAKDRLKALN